LQTLRLKIGICNIELGQENCSRTKNSTKLKGNFFNLFSKKMPSNMKSQVYKRVFVIRLTIKIMRSSTGADVFNKIWGKLTYSFCELKLPFWKIYLKIKLLVP
jgi:hypothetical protein